MIEGIAAAGLCSLAFALGHHQGWRSGVRYAAARPELLKDGIARGVERALRRERPDE